MLCCEQKASVGRHGAAPAGLRLPVLPPQKAEPSCCCSIQCLQECLDYHGLYAAYMIACRAQQQCQHSGRSSVCSCHANSSSCHTSSSSSQQVLPPLPAEAAGLDPDQLPDSSITDKQLEKAILQASSQLYDQLAAQGASLQRQLGNLYTASLYSGLAALISQQRDGLVGKRVLCFSFGSGVVSSMFVLRGRQQQVQQQEDLTTRQQQSQVCRCQQQRAWQQQRCSLQQMADTVSAG